MAYVAEEARVCNVRSSRSVYWALRRSVARKKGQLSEQEAKEGGEADRDEHVAEGSDGGNGGSESAECGENDCRAELLSARNEDGSRANAPLFAAQDSGSVYCARRIWPSVICCC